MFEGLSTEFAANGYCPASCLARERFLLQQNRVRRRTINITPPATPPIMAALRLYLWVLTVEYETELVSTDCEAIVLEVPRIVESVETLTGAGVGSTAETPGEDTSLLYFNEYGILTEFSVFPTGSESLDNEEGKLGSFAKRRGGESPDCTGLAASKAGAGAEGLFGEPGLEPDLVGLGIATGVDTEGLEGKP